MAVYINRIIIGDEIKNEVNSLITNASLRRRMTTGVKLSVASAIKITQEVGEIDAIITSTNLGLMNDSEKFLNNMVLNGNDLLTPTPFIQSTFNTVAAQIALLTKFHGYNMTYVQDKNRFFYALLDAVMLLEEGKHKVLLGDFDEVSEIVSKTCSRLSTREIIPGDRVVFFLVSDEIIGEDSLELKLFFKDYDKVISEKEYRDKGYNLFDIEESDCFNISTEIARICKLVISTKEPCVLCNHSKSPILIELKRV